MKYELVVQRRNDFTVKFKNNMIYYMNKCFKSDNIEDSNDYDYDFDDIYKMKWSITFKKQDAFIKKIIQYLNDNDIYHKIEDNNLHIKFFKYQKYEIEI